MTARAFKALGAVLTFGACSSGPGFGHGDAGAAGPAFDRNPPPTPFPLCSTMSTTPPRPIAHLGPDVSMRLSCGTTASRPIASISATEGAGFSWTASIAGPPGIFELSPSGGVTCARDPITVVSVTLTPPATAIPGDVFDTTVTFRADGDAFPPSQVHVHGEIAALDFEVDRTRVDFGAVPVGAQRQQVLTFSSVFDGEFLVRTTNGTGGPFSLNLTLPRQLDGHAALMGVLLDAVTPGDYIDTVEWQMTARRFDVPACVVTTTVRLHARVVADPDGGADDASGDDASGDGD